MYLCFLTGWSVFKCVMDSSKACLSLFQMITVATFGLHQVYLRVSSVFFIHIAHHKTTRKCTMFLSTILRLKLICFFILFVFIFIILILWWRSIQGVHVIGGRIFYCFIHMHTTNIPTDLCIQMRGQIRVFALCCFKTMDKLAVWRPFQK